MKIPSETNEITNEATNLIKQPNSFKQTIFLMFDRKNPKNVCNVCNTILSIPLIIFIIGVIWLMIVGLGYGATYATYSTSYNMTNGEPLFHGDKTKMACNSQLGSNLFGWCTWNGLFDAMVILGFAFVWGLLITGLYQLFELIKQSFDQNNKHKKILNIIMIILMILCPFALYFVTIYLGLAASYALNVGTYNMTTGWPLNSDYSKGILMCRHTLDGSFFVGCMFHGVVSDVIVAVGSILGGCLISLIVMGLCGPFWCCFKSCWDSYKFSKNYGISNDVTIQINPEKEYNDVSGE